MSATAPWLAVLVAAAGGCYSSLPTPAQIHSGEATTCRADHHLGVNGVVTGLGVGLIGLGVANELADNKISEATMDGPGPGSWMAILPGLAMILFAGPPTYDDFVSVRACRQRERLETAALAP